MGKKNGGLDRRNSLIIKIALFLNFLSKKNYNLLIKDIKKHLNIADIDVLKIMLAKKYIYPKDLPLLKNTCLNFAKGQADIRFGSLAIEFAFITRSNLDLALDEQKRLLSMGKTIRIGTLLVDAGMLSQRQRKLILQKQKIENAGSRTSSDDVNNAIKDRDVGKVFDPSHMREIQEPELTFYVQNDALGAFVKKTKDFDNRMLLADLKFLLEKAGIIYGVVDDSQLTNFINLPNYTDDVFQVAKGLDPIAGTDAHITYLFEIDYLKAGSMAEDGTIDFKDRGEIPFVEKGDVLAEKIPAKTGKDGVNVYGDLIPRTEATDLPFILGKGVELSRDELQVIASADGNPKLNPVGELSVNAAYFIEGDVDYTTGHIKFDKNVFISGTIKSGFRVEAIDVVANTIDGGIVQAQGDVFIQNGVTESSIEAKGSIKAGFIHRSKVMSMGDLNVFKEVVDTQVFIEGTLEMNRGKMYSSSVCARGGANIYAIGSEKAKPSQITVGTSPYMGKKLAAIDQTIEQKQHLLEDGTVEKNKFESEVMVITEKLRNFDQSKKRTLSMIQETENSKNFQKASLFQKSLDEADKKIHDLRDRKLLLESRMKKIALEISTNAQAVKDSVKEKFSIKRQYQKNPSRPILEISGKAFAATKIAGSHSHLILPRNISHSKIVEMDNRSGKTARSKWEMIITNL